MQTRLFTALDMASLICLVSATALAVPLVERATAAAWQWYKFSGYPGGGYITLSFSTALLYSGVLGTLLLVAFGIGYMAKQRAQARAAAWSRWAVVIVVATAALFWLLGASSLNAWRP